MCLRSYSREHPTDTLAAGSIQASPADVRVVEVKVAAYGVGELAIPVVVGVCALVEDVRVARLCLGVVAKHAHLP